MTVTVTEGAADVPLDFEESPPEEAPMLKEDPSAPWGRTKDGRPKGKPGPRPGRAGGAAKPGFRPPAKTSPAKAPKAKGPDYRLAVRSLLQLPAFTLTMIGKATGSDAFLADSLAISMHAEGIAEAAQVTAEAEPRFAAVLDRALKVGPWGALFGAVVPLALQMGVNHGLLAPAPQMGIVPKEVLLRAATTTAPAA